MSSDKFIKDTSIKMNMPEDIIHKVIMHQWKEVKAATLTESVIEISGMGRLMLRPRQVELNIAKYNNFYNAAVRELEALDKEDEQWYAAYKKVKSLEKDLAFLATKQSKK